MPKFLPKKNKFQKSLKEQEYIKSPSIIKKTCQYKWKVNNFKSILPKTHLHKRNVPKNKFEKKQKKGFF